MSTTPPTPETPTTPRPYYSQTLADARCRAVAADMSGLIVTHIGDLMVVGPRPVQYPTAAPAEEEVLAATLPWKAPAQLLNPPVMLPMALADARCRAVANIVFCAIHVDSLLCRHFFEDAEVEDQKELIAIGMRQLLGHTISGYAQNALDDEIEATLIACGETATWLAENEYDGWADEAKLLVTDAGKAFAAYLELRDKDTETPPTYDFAVAPQPGPPADGSEEICTEFTLHWHGLEATDHPLWEGLRLRLLTWATRNQTDSLCSNIVDDYLWAEILDTLGSGYSIFDAGRNYLDIALRPNATHDSPMIRVVQHYRFDPGYAKHHSHLSQRV